MLYKGSLIGPASGKLNGLVASHNAGGSYFRKLSIPTNPRSVQQQSIRNAMKAQSTAWVQTLTQTQRDSFTTYGRNMNFTNRLGDSIKYSGINCYNLMNNPRQQAGTAVVTTAPTQYDRGTFSQPTLTIAAAGTTVSVAFTNTDGWAIAAGGAMYIYASRSQNASKVSFGGPYRLAGKINGAGTPPTSPAVITLPFVVGPTGSKMFFRVQVTQPDGRLSSAVYLPVLVP